jgi:hypothetical protein
MTDIRTTPAPVNNLDHLATTIDEHCRRMLVAVCDLDIASALGTAEEAEGLDLPLGFGRDE